jgi:thioesterase domain-containing protein
MLPDLGKILGRKLQLSIFLEAPSVAELAATLEHKYHSPSSGLVQQIKSGGSRPPFFFIHGAGGNVLLYRQLAMYLKNDIPCYGIQCKGLDSKEPYHTTIEDMATEYIKEIKKIQSQGPYFFGGYCMGGMVAYEIGHKLAESGEKTGLIALFDTHSSYRDEQRIYYKSILLLQNIGFHMANLLMLNPIGQYDFFKTRASEAMRRIKRQYDVWFSKSSSNKEPNSEKPFVRIERINDTACQAYTAKPYGANLDIFKPKSAYIGQKDPLLGWGNSLCNNITMHQLSVYPAGMLVEPFVKELAEKLNQRLAISYNDFEK